jgi:hypothetical protein
MIEVTNQKKGVSTEDFYSSSLTYWIEEKSYELEYYTGFIKGMHWDVKQAQ